MKRIILLVCSLLLLHYAINDNNIFGFIQNKTLRTIVLFIILLSCIYSVMDYTYFFPSLGKTLMPIPYVKDVQPQHESGDIYELKVNVEPESKVIYWTSSPTKNGEEKSFDVYVKDYKNSGITKANKNGIATLRFLKPSRVTIFGKVFEPVVYYRYGNDHGFMSKINVVKFEDEDENYEFDEKIIETNNSVENFNNKKVPENNDYMYYIEDDNIDGDEQLEYFKNLENSLKKVHFHDDENDISYVENIHSGDEKNDLENTKFNFVF